MLNIKTFCFNLLQENTYVVSDDSLECVIIDCGVISTTTSVSTPYTTRGD